MEGLDFAIGGEGAFEGYNYVEASEVEISFFDKEPTYDAQVSSAMKPLHERVLQNQTPRHTLSTVDNVLKVKTLNANVRQEKADFWKSRRLEMWGTAGVSFLSTLGLGFLAVSNAASLGGILAAASVLTFGVSILTTYRGIQASRQVSKWSLDLPVTIANLRKLAFDGGLLQALENDTKGQSYPLPYSEILTTTELQGLYNSYFHDVAKKFERGGNAKEQLALITQIANNGPLSSHVYSYGRLHPQFIQWLAYYINENEKFVDAFESIERRSLDQEKQAKELANEKRSLIEKQKNAALDVVNRSYEEYSSKLGLEKAGALSLISEDLKAREEINKEYQQKEREAKRLKDAAKATISEPYNLQLSLVEKEKDQYVRDVRTNRDAQLLPFYNHLRLIHTNAYRVLIGKPPSAFPTLSDPFSLSFQPPVFNIPPYVPPAYEATFDGIRVKHHVDQAVYNQFMSIYGQYQPVPN